MQQSQTNKKIFDLLTSEKQTDDNKTYREYETPLSRFNPELINEVSKQFMYAHGYRTRIQERTWTVEEWMEVVTSVNTTSNQRTNSRNSMRWSEKVTNVLGQDWHPMNQSMKPLIYARVGGGPSDFLQKMFNKLVKRNKVFPGLIPNDDGFETKLRKRKEAWGALNTRTNTLYQQNTLETSAVLDQAQQTLEQEKQALRETQKTLDQAQRKLRDEELESAVNFVRNTEKDIIEIAQQSRSEMAERNFKSALESHRSARKNAAKAAKRIRQINSFETRQKIAELPYDIRELLFVHWLKITFASELVEDFAMVYYGFPKQPYPQRDGWWAASEGSEVDLGEGGTLSQSEPLIAQLKKDINIKLKQQIYAIQNIQLFDSLKSGTDFKLSNMFKKLGQVISEFDKLLVSPDDDLWIDENNNTVPVNNTEAIIYQNTDLITIKVKLDQETDSFKYTINCGGYIFDIYSYFEGADDFDNLENWAMRLADGWFMPLYNKKITDKAIIFGGTFDGLMQEAGKRRGKAYKGKARKVK